MKEHKKTPITIQCLATHLSRDSSQLSCAARSQARSFPSSSLGMQYRKLQLPVSRSWSFAHYVPKLKLGNERKHKKTPITIQYLIIALLYLSFHTYCLAAAPEAFKFNVKHFSIEGLMPLSESFFVNYFKPLQNRPYTLKELQDVSKALEQQIQKQGYPLYRVIVPPQSLANGDIKLQIVTVNTLNCKVTKP